MSWQQPGGYNPNANAYVPGGGYGGGMPPAQGGVPQQGGAGGYYPQQGGAAGNYYPQQGGAGGYYPQQGGAGGNYYPQQGGAGGGYYPQQGGYSNNNNYQGGYQAPQQQGGGYGGGRGRGGQYQNYSNNQALPQQQQQQQPPQQSRDTAPVAAQPQHADPSPAVAKADAAKLALGGSSAAPVVVPKKKGGATLSLGKKKKEADEKPAQDADEAKAANEAAKAGDAAGSKSEKTEKTEEKSRDQLSGEELRAFVRKELAKQRKSDKKLYVRDPRPHYNIVICGHVDAGKSTISGHLLMEKGQVDQREMDKLRREAENHHREGWEYAYVMDVGEDERQKGITRETGAAYFETDKRRVTVLDAPGHKAFVPSMIGGAAQADVCVLVISSRTGEFETGFEKGGQTREHTMLVRTCGVRQMLCVVNKMDEMNWSEERYTEIVDKLRPFLKQNGYDEKNNNLMFIPIAGLTGENLIEHTDKCPWYSGPSLMEAVDTLELPESKTDEDVLCIPLVGSYKDDGKNYIYGKVESGSIAVGEKIQLLPTKLEGLVEGISIESTEFEKCYPGDNVHLRVRGIDENDVHAGYVATSVPTSLKAVEFFQARVVVLEVKNIICAGSRFMLHLNASQEEASVHKLLAKVDKKTGEVVEKDPACAKAGDVVIARIEVDRAIVVEPHKDFDKMGRFMLRDDGKTIAIGLVTKLYESTRETLGQGKTK